MSERNFPTIGLILIINVVVMFVEYSLFQNFGGLYTSSGEDEAILIFAFICLIVMALISVNFIITLIISMTKKEFESINKLTAVITLITIFLLLFQLFISFLAFAGAFS
jgi:hypothetical protein